MKKIKTKVGAKISTETKLLLSVVMLLSSIGFMGFANGLVRAPAKVIEKRIVKLERITEENNKKIEKLVEKKRILKNEFFSGGELGNTIDDTEEGSVKFYSVGTLNCCTTYGRYGMEGLEGGGCATDNMPAYTSSANECCYVKDFYEEAHYAGDDIYGCYDEDRGCQEDECGVCGGDGSSCMEEGELFACDNNSQCGSEFCNDNGYCEEYEVFCPNGDECNGGQTCDSECITNGFAYPCCVPTFIIDNSVDCEGTFNGDVVLDECGVCGGDNSSCADCSGTPNGNAMLDNCNTCDANPNNDCSLDCSGVWGGNAYEDYCGVCDSDPDNNNQCSNYCSGHSDCNTDQYCYNHICETYRPDGCSWNFPCDEGESDCNFNSDCAGNLVCGTNNCSYGGINGVPDFADCCMQP